MTPLLTWAEKKLHIDTLELPDGGDPPPFFDNDKVPPPPPPGAARASRAHAVSRTSVMRARVS